MGKKEKKASEDKGPGLIERFFLRMVINKAIKKIENMKGSWKTSLLGWAILVGVFAKSIAALIDGDPSTVFDFAAVLNALKEVGILIPAGIGLLFARDKGVSTEEQKAASSK